MKKIILIVLLIVIMSSGGYFAYQTFFTNEYSDVDVYAYDSYNNYLESEEYIVSVDGKYDKILDKYNLLLKNKSGILDFKIDTNENFSGGTIVGKAYFDYKNKKHDIELTTTNQQSSLKNSDKNEYANDNSQTEENSFTTRLFMDENRLYYFDKIHDNFYSFGNIEKYFPVNFQELFNISENIIKTTYKTYNNQIYIYEKEDSFNSLIEKNEKFLEGILNKEKTIQSQVDKIKSEVISEYEETHDKSITDSTNIEYYDIGEVETLIDENTFELQDTLDKISKIKEKNTKRINNLKNIQLPETYKNKEGLLFLIDDWNILFEDYINKNEQIANTLSQFIKQFNSPDIPNINGLNSYLQPFSGILIQEDNNMLIFTLLGTQSTTISIKYNPFNEEYSLEEHVYNDFKDFDKEVLITVGSKKPIQLNLLLNKIFN